MSRFKSSLKKAVPSFIVGIILILILVAIIGTGDIAGALSRVDKRIYLLAFLIHILAIGVWLYKWKVITNAIDLDVGARRMFPILLSGIFVNTLLPSAKVGGEPLRAYIFSRLGEITIDKSFATVAADRAVDAVSFLTILLVSLTVALSTWSLSIYATALLLGGAAFMAVFVILYLYVCLRPDPARGVINWFIRRLRWIIRKFRPIEYVQEKIEMFLESFGERVRLILGSKRYVSMALLLSSLYWFLAIFRMWLVFRALGYSAPFVAIALAITLGMVLQAVPIPGGLGIVESGYLLIFQAAGLPPDVALSAALLDRGISFWFTGLFSTAGIAWSGLELSKTWEA